MTIKELLESLPEDQRKLAAELFYSRIPYGYKTSDRITEQDTAQPLPEPFPSSVAQ